MVGTYGIALADYRPVLLVGIVTTQPSRRVLFRLDPRWASPYTPEGAEVHLGFELAA